MCHVSSIEALPSVLESRGKRHLFQGNRKQRPNLRRTVGTKKILGNREHKKANFWYLGSRVTISGEHGDMYFPGVPQYSNRYEMPAKGEYRLYSNDSKFADSLQFLLTV